MKTMVDNSVQTTSQSINQSIVDAEWVSAITGLEYGMEWWNGTVNVHNYS